MSGMSKPKVYTCIFCHQSYTRVGRKGKYCSHVCFHKDKIKQQYIRDYKIYGDFKIIKQKPFFM